MINYLANYFTHAYFNLKKKTFNWDGSQEKEKYPFILNNPRYTLNQGC